MSFSTKYCNDLAKLTEVLWYHFNQSASVLN